jgi:hypothetical protein
MADRVSVRRGVANSFFLTVNTGLAALLGGEELRWYVAVAGIVLFVTWWALLKSYRDLNAAKFDVILAMEVSLPARVFGEESGSSSRLPAAPRRGAPVCVRGSRSIGSSAVSSGSSPGSSR